ncbi:DUF4184 family protein [Geodermatophilus sp. SYSU D00815]
MPFTGSHPAAVLPFLRTPLPASGLVIGSTAPDLPFYLPLPQWYATHSAPALVTSDLLIGLLAWAVWHGVLAAPALAAAPAPLRGRLSRLGVGLRGRLASGRQALLLVAALVLGGATHLLWDEFTHAGRWGPEQLPALAAAWGPLPGYRWLQYAGSVAGLAVLAAWLVRWWRRTPCVPAAGHAAGRWVWPLLAGVGLAAGLTAAAGTASLDDAVFPGARWAGGAVLVSGVLLAAAWHLRRRVRLTAER